MNHPHSLSPFKFAAPDSRVYNCADAPGFEKGIYSTERYRKNPKDPLNKKARYYSAIERHENGMIVCESWDIFGRKEVELIDEQELIALLHPINQEGELVEL